MNKTITLIASAIAVLGLGTLYALGNIDATTFGTVTVAVLSTLFGLYKNFETNKMKIELIEKSEKLFEVTGEVVRLNSNLTRLHMEHNKQNLELQSLKSVDMHKAISEDTIIIKPKPKHKKKKE